jgi:hypothetical protein
MHILLASYVTVRFRKSHLRQVGATRHHSRSRPADIITLDCMVCPAIQSGFVRFSYPVRYTARLGP